MSKEEVKVENKNFGLHSALVGDRATIEIEIVIKTKDGNTGETLTTEVLTCQPNTGYRQIVTKTNNTTNIEQKFIQLEAVLGSIECFPQPSPANACCGD